MLKVEISVWFSIGKLSITGHVPKFLVLKIWRRMWTLLPCA